jgi:hypothetical protein
MIKYVKGGNSSSHFNNQIWEVKVVRSDLLVFFKLINVYIFKTNCKSYTLSANYTNNLDRKKNLIW